MYQVAIAQRSIEQALLELQPKQLLGLDLLEQHQSKTNDDSLPTNIDLRVRLRAMHELREYAEACVAVTTRVQSLGACPIDSPLVKDFAL